MPTIIPSNNIFNIKNSKVINNKISKVEFENYKLNNIKYTFYNNSFDVYTKKAKDNAGYGVYIYENKFIENNTDQNVVIENNSDNTGFFIKITIANSYKLNPANGNDIELFIPTLDDLINKKDITFGTLTGDKNPSFLSNIVSFEDFKNKSTGANYSYHITDANTLEVYLSFSPSAGYTDILGFKHYTTKMTIVFNFPYVEPKQTPQNLGEGTKTLALTSNSFMTDGSTIANKILQQYQNGKETAVIDCAIGEYKDKNGNIVISTTQQDLPMTFNIGDIVEPYTTTVYGEVPLSVNSTTHEPKQFVVIGIKIKNDGAMSQELTLQEYVPTN